MIIRYV